MEVMDALVARFSCRAFLPVPVDRRTLRRVLQAALKSPSWANTQPWEVFVADGAPLERLRAAYRERFEAGVEAAPEFPRPRSWPAAHAARTAELMAVRYRALGVDAGDERARREAARGNFRFFGAPAVLFLGLDRELGPWSLFDLGAFAHAVMLAARASGLDSVPAVMLASYPDLVRAELKVPEQIAIAIGVALGRADEAAAANGYRSERRALEDVARFCD